MAKSARDLLLIWLTKRIAPEGAVWFAEKCAALQEDRAFNLAFALAPRKLGKQDLALSPAELADADACHERWCPDDWTIDQAARMVLLLSDQAEDVFKRRVHQISVTGDVSELVTLYAGLPIYPFSKSLTDRAAEGLRSNIKAVFEAVAHGNPFPADHFEDGPWNQMVIKALFIGSRLHPILSLDRRANEDLTRILIDYMHERLAAGRTITPELWRCVGPYFHLVSDADLERVRTTDDTLEQQGLALALAKTADPRARELLAKLPNLVEAIDSRKLTWSSIHESISLS
jgi:hypothetical protein